MLSYTPVECNCLETLAKTSVIPARRNQFIQRNIFNNAPVRRIAIAILQTPHSLDITLKIRSVINSSILDKLENSEVVKEL